MSSETESEKLPPYVEHSLVHYKQRYDWDCGVSCVIMLLAPAQRDELLERFHDVCREEGFGHSTWTIDLCYLLKRYGIKHVMYTTMMGVNEEYRKHSYYSRIMDLDRERVQSRFLGATPAGLVVRHALLSSRELARHVARHGPALVLVDAGLLVCALCKHNKLRAEFRRCFGGSYRGHYIVVSGVVSDTNTNTRHKEARVLYHDPALSARVCCVPLTRLDEARRATGTDYDVILVEQDLVGQCNDAASYCGLRNRLYPDKKHMGYPFDRRGRDGVNNLSDFLTPNMAVRDVSIRFTDATRQRRQ